MLWPDRFVACSLAMQRAAHDGTVGCLGLLACQDNLQSRCGLLACLLCMQALWCRGLPMTLLPHDTSAASPDLFFLNFFVSCRQRWKAHWAARNTAAGCLGFSVCLLSMHGRQCRLLLMTPQN